MVVLPELLLPGYNSDRISDLAQPAEGAWVERLCAMANAAGCGMALGYGERLGDTLYNSAVAIAGNGKVLAHYRKVQLFGPREAEMFRPGDRFVTFDHAGRKMALLICYDVEFGPHVRALARAGVDLVLVPTANMLPWSYVCDATVPSQSATHGVAIAYANYCGIEGELTYCGGSVITGQEGQILAKAGLGPALLIADLPERVEPGRIATHLSDYRAGVLVTPS